jgi:PadR family transcriptional regulator PadR
LREIDKKSQGSYQIKQATLYSCLKRLEKSGLIKAFWGEGDSTGGGRRRYYSLTKNGREFLNRNKLDSEHTRALLHKFLAETDSTETSDKDDSAFVAFVENVEKEKAYSDAEISNDGVSEKFVGSVEAEKTHLESTEISNAEKSYSDILNGFNADKKDETPRRRAETLGAVQTSLFDEAASSEEPTQSLSAYKAQSPSDAQSYSPAYTADAEPQNLSDAPTDQPAVQPIFAEISHSRAVYELPEDFAEKKAADIKEEIKEAPAAEEDYIPYTASRYDFHPLDAKDEQERARIQREEYYKEYERTIAEKEISAGKLYDTMYAPSLPYSSVVKEKLPPPPPPEPPASQPIYADRNDLFATYAPKNTDETDDLSEDEKKDYASKKLGIGRYRDPGYASKIISENERIQAKNNRAKEDSSYPPARTAADEKPSNLSAAVNASDAVEDKIFGEFPNNSNAYEQTGNETKNAEFDDYKDGDGDKNIKFLDENELKFQQFEKYDAENDKDVNYKSVFTDEILVKRVAGGYRGASKNANFDDANADERDDGPTHFHDVKNKLANEGYEIKAYNKANTSEFYAKNYIFNRKINAHTYLTAWGVWLVEIFMAATIFSDFFKFGLLSAEFWCFALIPAVVPLFFLAAYGANSGKRKKDDFDVKRAVKTNLIVAAVLFVLTSVIALCFLGATVGGNWRISILAPAILFTNIPLSAVIYDTLRKTRKYNLS